MHKQIYPLLVAQFLSAFADNAILFTVIAMVLQNSHAPNWYVPALQSMFLVAFVIFAPWVGHIADSYPKARILMIGNALKAIGAALLLMGSEPLLAYGIVGIGAALYGPAKYGILPELAGHEFLIKANAWIEGSTILAILTGMVIGAKVADYSIVMALSLTLVLFILSAFITLWLPHTIYSAQKNISFTQITQFLTHVKTFFIQRKTRFIILSCSLFWATAATLRVILIAWSPLVLNLYNATDIAQLTLYLAVGIIVGSTIVPYLINIDQLKRVQIPAYFMGLLIIGLSFVDILLFAQSILFFIGMMGGIFIVPINAVLQEHGWKSIGGGNAVAVQNFFQNASMLIAVGSYTFASAQGMSPVIALLSLGILVIGATFLVAWRLNE